MTRLSFISIGVLARPSSPHGSAGRRANPAGVCALWRTVLAAAAAVVVGSAGPAAAQGGDYTVPRTPYGHPDLQGFWSNQTYTPLQRPDGVSF